jgi:hypothetical protein
MLEIASCRRTGTDPWFVAARTDVISTGAARTNRGPHVITRTVLVLTELWLKAEVRITETPQATLAPFEQSTSYPFARILK